jgi:hypothetical protein
MVLTRFPIMIVGLQKATNGRTCDDHEICGEQVKVSDLLFLTCCQVEGRLDYMIVIYGYLPNSLMCGIQ